MNNQCWYLVDYNEPTRILVVKPSVERRAITFTTNEGAWQYCHAAGILEFIRFVLLPSELFRHQLRDGEPVDLESPAPKTPVFRRHWLGIAL